jgi:hypothetical protein
MRIILFGKEIDSTKELELFSKDHDAPFGFTMNFWRKASIDGDMKAFSCSRRNCHEIHINYRAGNTAFESDRHSNGGTRSHEDNDLIVITKSPGFYSEHCGDVYATEPGEIEAILRGERDINY